MSSPTRCDVEKNVHSILQHNTSMEVQNIKKLKKNQSSSVVSSDNDSLYPKKYTRPQIETANTSKENISASYDAESIEKSPSVISTHSQ